MPVARIYLKERPPDRVKSEKNLLSPLFVMIFLALALQLLGIRDAVSATDLGGGVIDTISKLGGISSTLILITVGYRIHMDNPTRSGRACAWSPGAIF